MSPSSPVPAEIPATFRANVGLAVLNDRGEVLAVERSDSPGAWQLPQGGIDPEESPEQAAWRELEEETGLRKKDVRLLGVMPDWVVYELPLEWRRKKTGWGQAQKWFVFRLALAPHSLFQVGPLPEGQENRAQDFKPFAEIAATIPAFRREVYAKLGSFLARFETPKPT
jgi:putative (di)nucleoside polyphosphate hydrolase